MKAKGWHPAIYPTGLFIRDYLLQHRTAYPFQIYRALVEARKSVGVAVGSPINFYKYIWCLEQLGLIRRTGRVEPSTIDHTRKRLPRRLWRIYFEIVPGKEDDPAWLHPQKEIAKRRGWRSIPGKRQKSSKPIEEVEGY
jgi:hypothetical protein